jgi:hypothetical protein
LYFDRGIDDYASWLKALKEAKIVKQKGAWTFYGTGEDEEKFQGAGFEEWLNSDPERKSKLYEQICEHVIMSYRKSDDEPLDFSDVLTIE